MTTMKNPPPSRAGRKAKYMTPGVIENLHVMPTCWMVLDHHSKNAASSVAAWCKRHTDYETTSRVQKLNPDLLDIYVRYLGTD